MRNRQARVLGDYLGTVTVTVSSTWYYSTCDGLCRRPPSIADDFGSALYDMVDNIIVYQ